MTLKGWLKRVSSLEDDEGFPVNRCKYLLVQISGKKVSLSKYIHRL